MRTALGIMFGLAALTVVLHLDRPPDPVEMSDCEAARSGLVRQPGNATSALAIVITGVVISRRGSAGRHLGDALVVAGGASVIYHASLHPLAARLDGFGVVLAGAAALHFIVRHRPPPTRVVPAAVIGTIGLVVWAGSRTGGHWCDPDTILGGHALWHLVIALAVVVLALPGMNRSTSPSP